MPIRQYHNVSRLEVDFRLSVGDECDVLKNPVMILEPTQGLLNGIPILLAIFGIASNDQPVIACLGHDLPKCLDQEFEAFIGGNVTKEEDCSILLGDTKSLPRLVWSQICVRNRIIDTIWNNRNVCCRHIELCNEFPPHSLRVHKEMIDKPILDF